MIPLTRPVLDSAEAAACARVLASGMLVQGAEVRAFEAALAAVTGRSQVIAVGNGTQALELALRALGIGVADHVLCPALTWPSPAHAIRSIGATPVLVDVDARTWNSRADLFAAARTPATRCAIAIDQFGAPADHPAIADALPGLPIVVDGACSLGSTLHGRPALGYGVIACTSFHPRKVITTGEGGACLTDDAALAERLRTLRNHGQSAPGTFSSASGNARLTELQAAIGRVQLEKLPGLVAARRALRARSVAALPALHVQADTAGAVANGQTFGVFLSERVDSEQVRDDIVRALAERGVMAGRLSYALSLLPQFRGEAHAAEGRSLRVSCALHVRGLALPLFPSMTDDELAQVVAAVTDVIVKRGFA